MGGRGIVARLQGGGTQAGQSAVPRRLDGTGDNGPDDRHVRHLARKRGWSPPDRSGDASPDWEGRTRAEPPVIQLPAEGTRLPSAAPASRMASLTMLSILVHRRRGARPASPTGARPYGHRAARVAHHRHVGHAAHRFAPQPHQDVLISRMVLQVLRHSGSVTGRSPGAQARYPRRSNSPIRRLYRGSSPIFPAPSHRPWAMARRWIPLGLLTCRAEEARCQAYQLGRPWRRARASELREW